jgi:hypothetical protein
MGLASSARLDKRTDESVSSITKKERDFKAGSSAAWQGFRQMSQHRSPPSTVWVNIRVR